jgi:hypothetical protein
MKIYRFLKKIIIITVFILYKLNSTELLIDSSMCNRIEIHYDRYVVGCYCKKKDKEIVKFYGIDYWEYLSHRMVKEKFERNKIYIYFGDGFINDSVTLYRKRFNNKLRVVENELLYSNILNNNENMKKATDSIIIEKLWDSYEEMYFDSDFMININDMTYHFGNDNNLIFLIINYDHKNKLVKIINTNRIPEF